MNKVTDLQIVENIERTELEDKVHELMKDGWQPLGPAGMAFYPCKPNDGPTLANYDQAWHITMVKYAP